MPASPETTAWRPQSWTLREAAQQAIYEDPDALRTAIDQLKRLPPLVTSWEIDSLQDAMARAGRGECFILQGGDCSESLDECSHEGILRDFKVLLQMSLVLASGTRRPVVRIGRVAGQYAKPRSSHSETRDTITLPAYRGDLVNRAGFSESERCPDPTLLLRCYEKSALTLNFMRALSAGGFADLHHPENWSLDVATESPFHAKYNRLVESILHAIAFSESITGSPLQGSGSVDFFTSHEGLHLPYEESLTRQPEGRPGWYNLGVHFPWIGNRTRQIDGAHVEYFRGIANPVGMKVDGTMAADELVALLDVLNPDNTSGKVALIHRFGTQAIGETLPRLIRGVKDAKKSVTWIADPMHGNTYVAPDGRKTRSFEAIITELRDAFAIHDRMGSCLGGVHLELTGDRVTECVGGAIGVSEGELGRSYKSAVDPRLNYDQAMEAAFMIAETL